MEIKRSAWHYKISNYYRGEKSNDSICDYFWRLVKNVGSFIFKGLVILALIVIAVAFGYMVISDIPLLIVVLWMTSTCLFPPLTIWFIREKLGKPPETPYGNIVVAYMKAKKEKVCPLITYTD
jgi:hypothetical protein